MNHLITTIFLFIISASIFPIGTNEGVLNNLYTIAPNYYKTGFRLDLERSATTEYEKGQYYGLDFHFFDGNEYVIFAVGDETTKDIELSLYDEAGEKEIAIENKKSPIAILALPARKIVGKHKVFIKLTDAAGKSGYVMFVVGFK